MRYLVYLGYYSDDNTYTKIGESKDIYSRTCSYNTSDPINDFKVICLIELDTEEDMHNMELYLLLHYDDYKARHDVNYKHRNPDNEWITIRPTKTDITYIVKDNIINIPHTILSEEETNIVLHDIQEKQNKDYNNKQILRNKIKKKN